MDRPRAADDFATIRARLKELRHERSLPLPGDTDVRPVGPRLRETADIGLSRRDPPEEGRGGLRIDRSRHSG